MSLLGNLSPKKILKYFTSSLFLILISAIAFAFVIFPFNDLTDLISSKVSEQTQNRVFLQLDGLNLNLVPQPGLELENVYVETLTTPALTAEKISASPSVRGLIQRKPYYGTISATGILGGDIEIATSKAPATEKSPDRLKISITADNLALTKVKDLASLPIALKGKMNAQANIEADMGLVMAMAGQADPNAPINEQPDVDVNLEISALDIPPANINLGELGALPTPELKLASLNIKARLADGTLIIDNAAIGKPTDELHGTIKGRIGLSMVNMGRRIGPQVTSYSLEIDLKAKKSFQDKASLFLTFLDSYKKDIPGGAHFKFKASAQDLRGGPSFSSMH